MGDEALIRTDGLGRQYGRRWVVRNLDLQVPRGSVYGFLGVNGAGKSTTIKMLMSLLHPHEGEARVLGLDPERSAIELKRRVGYVPEAPVFYEWMTIEQTLGFAAHYRRREWNARRAAQLVERFNLRPDAKIRELSKGMRMKTALVLAMAFEPELLILDEPTSGLDPVARQEFIEGVLSEYQESGRTILISSHLISELVGLVDQIGIMHEGHLLLHEPVDTFLGSLHRLRLDFEGDVPANLAITGKLSQRISGRSADVAVRTDDAAQLATEAEALGAMHYKIEPLALEEAFIEIARSAGKNKFDAASAAAEARR